MRSKFQNANFFKLILSTDVNSHPLKKKLSACLFASRNIYKRSKKQKINPTDCIQICSTLVFYLIFNELSFFFFTFAKIAHFLCQVSKLNIRIRIKLFFRILIIIN